MLIGLASACTSEPDLPPAADGGAIDGGAVDAAAIDAATSAPFTVRYHFATPTRAGCSPAGASLVDVSLFAGAEVFSPDDHACDDAAVVVLDVPGGIYDIEVVAWGEELWSGLVPAISHSPDLPAEVDVALTMIAPPPP